MWDILSHLLMLVAGYTLGIVSMALFVAASDRHNPPPSV